MYVGLTICTLYIDNFTLELSGPGTGTNTDAAQLAESFLESGCTTKVIYYHMIPHLKSDSIVGYIDDLRGCYGVLPVCVSLDTVSVDDLTSSSFRNMCAA